MKVYDGKEGSFSERTPKYNPRKRGPHEKLSPPVSERHEGRAKRKVGGLKRKPNLTEASMQADMRVRLEFSLSRCKMKKENEKWKKEKIHTSRK